MAKLPRFQESQYAFAAHIRDPQTHPAPSNIEDRRMAIYRDLFFNNVSGLLASTFPVVKKILTEQQWNDIVRDFFARHKSHTPYFLEIPKELIAYLQDERETAAGDPPFLFELAHYEWAELALTIDTTEICLEDIKRQGDLLSGRPVISPLAWSLAYSFPVQHISPDFLPQEAAEEPTFLVVYRDLADQVGFIEINAVTARLLELLELEEPKTGRELLTQIAGELNHPKPDVVIEGGRETLEHLRRHDIILGTRTA